MLLLAFVSKIYIKHINAQTHRSRLNINKIEQTNCFPIYFISSENHFCANLACSLKIASESVTQMIFSGSVHIQMDFHTYNWKKSTLLLFQSTNNCIMCQYSQSSYLSGMTITFFYLLIGCLQLYSKLILYFNFRVQFWWISKEEVSECFVSNFIQWNLRIVKLIQYFTV